MLILLRSKLFYYRSFYYRDLLRTIKVATSLYLVRRIRNELLTLNVTAAVALASVVETLYTSQDAQRTAVAWSRRMDDVILIGGNSVEMVINSTKRSMPS